MRFEPTRFSAVVACVLAASPALADYDSHPEIRPENRCVTAAGERFDHAAPNPVLDTIHCQRLTWDLPVTTAVGSLHVAAPFDEDPIPRFPRGVTDRIPPAFVADGEGFERDAPGRAPLCPEGELGWWESIRNEDSSPVIGVDGGTFEGQPIGDPATPKHAVRSSASDPLVPQSGPLYRLSCRRGVRVYLGPWQTGDDSAIFDRLTREQWMVFDNAAHLDRDALDPNHPVDDDGEPYRLEWNVASEFYNHFASHHATCYLPNLISYPAWQRCNDPSNPYNKAEFEEHCSSYIALGADGSRCDADDVDPGCSGTPGNAGFRNATQVPGRLSVSLPDERGAITLEKQVWRCNHHVVAQLPPGSYGMDRLADYRFQQGGLVNDTGRNLFTWDGHPIPPGTDPMGGAVGEIIIQAFTAPLSANLKPINSMFNAVPDAVTTYYPPFTWNYHTTLWFPPYDAAITTMAIHSHHRMVKGAMDILPANPLRPNSPDPTCGGSKNGPATNLYLNWEWEDAKVCQFWQEPDGPVVIRKGQAIATTCFVNNGVTPEAIKHGLVAGAAVELLRNMGAPIPDYPELVPASSWGDTLADSPVGDQLLYGTHPPINYRVVYKCAPNGPGTSNPYQYPTGGTAICSPNPAVDADGDYIDGPYQNGAQCPGAGWCEPSTILFRCAGEDEMCIGVAAYYALPRLGSADTHDEAMANLAAGKIDQVGLPGTHFPTDRIPGYMLGTCQDCSDLDPQNGNFGVGR